MVRVFQPNNESLGMDAMKVKLGKQERSQLRAALAGTKLAHGDVAALLRRYSALKTEMEFRE